MPSQTKERRGCGVESRWAVTVLFAAAMAWVESAVVYYLRTLIDRIEPYQTNPLPVVGGLGEAELVRELATMVMLLAVGWLAGQSRRGRFGYSLLAFGVWDILYYAFLKIMTGWPDSLLDWDILFLVPLPWWGPVWAPVSLALLMVVWGTLLSQSDQPNRPIMSHWAAWGIQLAGVMLALYIFMADAIQTAGQGTVALREMLPTDFPWLLFLVALVLIGGPVWAELQSRLRGRTDAVGQMDPPQAGIFSRSIGVWLDGSGSPRDG